MKLKLILFVVLLSTVATFSQKQWTLQECVDEALRKNITIQQNKLSLELAKKDNRVLPQNGFVNKLEFNIGGKKVYAEFFGQGHTSDNIIGYILLYLNIFLMLLNSLH